VLLGQALRLEVWDQGHGRLAFVTRGAEDGELVLVNGRAELVGADELPH
jgi:hypothetical protein